MADESGRFVDITSAGSSPESKATTPSGAQKRPWIGVYFECCDVYARVYRDPHSPLYEGRCPRCGRPIRVRVGPDGVNSRIFRARPV